jgi:lysophospholipase L1-like esterase
MQKANSLMSEQIKSVDNTTFTDLGNLLLDAQGTPNSTCYVQDNLHLSDEGYRRWSEALLKVIQ